MKYQILTADPPWDFLTRSAKGRKKSPKYPVMELHDLYALPVEPALTENAALFLWVTWPFIPFASFLMEFWGFKYRTLAFDWFKTTKHGKPAFGTGYYFRAGPEACLLGVRGVMPVSVRNERNVIIAPAREHSRKPDEAYDKMEAVYPRAKYPARLELFASQYSAPVARAHGFEVLGYDVDGRDIRQSLPELLGAGKE